MIITDYYSFLREDEKTRCSEFISTESYPPFEILRNKGGKLFLYLSKYQKLHSKVNPEKLPNLWITKGKNLSGIFGIDRESDIGYGDMIGTKDALIFEFDGPTVNTMDIFILRGQKPNKHHLYTMFKEGEFKDEVDRIKAKAEELEKAKSAKGNSGF